MKKVLVTGATGFIGNHVVNELLSKGFDVIATSTSLEKAASYAWFDRVHYIPFVLKNDFYTQNLYDFFYKPDILIHLAWEGLPNYVSDFHVLNNYPAHFKFLENLIHHGLGDITVSGTCFEYGMTEGCLTETMDCNPVTAYGKAKLKLLDEIKLLQRRKDFNFKWIRLFYMYGQGQNSKSLTSQLEQALDQHKKYFNMSGGEQKRDFLSVELVANYIMTIASQESVQGIINCCSGIPVTVKEFVEQYLKKLNKAIELNLGFYPYNEYEPMHFWGDNKKLNLILPKYHHQNS